MKVPPFLDAARQGWGTLSRYDGCGVVLAVLLINLTLTLYTGLVTLRDFPNSADEYALQVSALLFAEGRLSVPSPEPREALTPIHTVNDGKFYGKYSPGWPLLLAAGYVAGVPWALNPLFGALAVLLLYRIARAHYSPEVANLALLCTVCSPFLIFNSASYFTHPSCHVFVLLAFGAILECAKGPERVWPFAVFGLAGGAAFLVRPQTAVAALIPLGAFLVMRLRRERLSRDLAVRALAALAPLGVSVALFLTYNYLQTGHPLLLPISKYGIGDGLGRMPSSMGYDWALKVNLLERMIDLTLWVPLSGFFLLAFPVLSLRSRTPEEILPAVLVAVLLGLYFFYLFPPGNEYGPRYLFESAFAVFLVLGLVLRRLPRAAPLLVLLVVGLNVFQYRSCTRRFGGDVAGRLDLYDRVRELGLKDAIVLLETGSGSMPPGDLVRNGIHFDGPVLYALDQGVEARTKLRERFPGRTVYVYYYIPEENRGYLGLRITP